VIIYFLLPFCGTNLLEINFSSINICIKGSGKCGKKLETMVNESGVAYAGLLFVPYWNFL
jgi:hypothetical protein